MALLQRFSTVSSRSWHYRLIMRVHKAFGESTEIGSPCYYWLVELPLSILTAAAAVIVAAAFTGGIFWILGTLAVRAVQNPVAFLGNCGIVLGLAVLLFVLGAGYFFAEKWLKRHCPPLTVRED